MLSLASSLWPYILSGSWKFTIACEVEAFAGRSTLYYAQRDVTWNSNSYTGAIVAWEPPQHQMEFRVPSCTVTIANATNALRAYLTPTDTLTGARLTVRMLLFDSGGSVLTDSLVLFKGIIEPPRRVTETRFDLIATGLLDGAGVDCPSRRLSLTCPWPFANARTFDGNGHCSYQSNTTASGAGASSTTLTLPSQTANGAGTNSVTLVLNAAGSFKNGDLIKIGTNDPVTVLSGGGTTTLILAFTRTWSNGNTVVCYIANGSSIQIGGGSAVTVSSGGGTTSLTLSATRTWNNGDTVRHADCPGRTRGECEARGMLHRFGGFPSVAITSRLVRWQGGGLGYGPPPTGPSRNPRDRVTHSGNDYGRVRTLRNLGGQTYAVGVDPVPVLYGRRRFTPTVIEDVSAAAPTSAVFQRSTFYVLSSGTISAVKKWLFGGVRGVEDNSGPYKRKGTYVRAGGKGTADGELASEYVSDFTTVVRSQNTDFRSFALVAYSETAYLIFVQDYAGALDPTAFEADVEGILIQRYNSDGSTNGARAYDVNPIWHAIDLATSDVFGMKLLSTDVDHGVGKTESDYAAVLLTATEANTSVTVAQGSATTKCVVTSTEGFILGRRVDVNGSSNTVADIVSATELTLGTAVTQSVGHTVIQRPQRFESHGLIDNIQKGTRWIKSILDSCRGYVTYDAGKIQFRIERDTCKERLTDGGFETWASSTDLTAGTETVSAGNTINREGTIKRTGIYALNLHRTSTGNLNERVTMSAVEPGRWYRLAVYDYGGAANLTNAAQVRIYNSTTAKYLNADGITWQAGATACISNTPANGAWTQREITFLADPAGASTDTIYIYFVHNETSPVNGDVYFDDASLRGPYAGDFREFTDSRFVGMKEGSFAWDLDRKDRETNQVRVRFFNESGFFGDDEAVANDFVHQETHPTKSADWDGSFVCDRDQATRLATWRLAKSRTLATGCEFIATPAAVAVQPGDIILVSHTVPNWTCKEQRVIAATIIGGPDDDEIFVKITTEDYLESIYSDVGPTQSMLPAQATPTVSATVTRNAGGALDLSLTLSDPTVIVSRWDIYMSDTTGFTPDAINRIGTTTASLFHYNPNIADLDLLRYFVVVAITERGTILSSEFSTTIFRNETATSGYSNNFKFPTTIQSVDPATGTNAYVNESGGAATVAKINDGSDATYLKGTATGTAGVADDAGASIRYHSFGAGTGKTGRPYIRAKITYTGGLPSHQVVQYFYTLDRTAGSPTWVKWQQVTSSTITDYFGPELSGIDYSKFAIRATSVVTNGGSIDLTVVDFNYAVAFDEKA